MPDEFAGFRYREIAGVPVLWRRDDRFKTFRVLFQVRRPLETREGAAARYLLPSLMLQGTERDPDRPALARRMESLYGAGVIPSVHKHGEAQVLRLTLDAVSGRYLPGKPDQCEDGLKFLADYLAHPRLAGDGFPSVPFEREREMAVDVARSVVDDRSRYAGLRSIELACAGEPMAIPEFGSVEALRALHRAAPETARLDLLRHGEAWMIAFGALPDEDFVEHVERFLEALPERDPLPVGDAVAVEERPRRSTIERVELQQSKLVLVFRFPWSMDPHQWVARRLFVSMLGGGPHSRLFREVREARSLAYYAQASVSRHKGLLFVDIGLDESAAEAAESETVRQIAELCSGQFTDDEFETARAGLMSSALAVDDSASRRCEYTSESWMLQSDRTPAQTLELLRDTGRDAVASAGGGIWLDTSFLLAPTDGGPS